MSDPLGLINNNSPVQPAQPNAPRNPHAPNQADGPAFKDVLMKNIEQVNKLQQDAATAIEDLQSGKRDDVDQVMMAQKKADVAFKMLVQIRNQLVDAYEEVKQMRV